MFIQQLPNHIQCFQASGEKGNFPVRSVEEPWLELWLREGIKAQ
jgi:hypothetical protein